MSVGSVTCYIGKARNRREEAVRVGDVVDLLPDGQRAEVVEIEMDFGEIVFTVKATDRNITRQCSDLEIDCVVCQ